MKTNRDELLKRLALLRPAIKTASLVPELQHIWFKDQGAFAFDGELGICISLDSGLECGVPGGPLLALLGTSRLPEVSLAPDDPGSSLVVKMGRSRSKLAVMDLERGVWPFPVKSKKVDGTGVVEVTDDLLGALRWVLVVEPLRVVTRAEHRGVHVYPGKNETVISSTDSSTIALTRVSGVLGAADVALLPRAFIEQLVSLGSAGDKLLLRDDYLAANTVDALVYSHVENAEGMQDLRVIMAEVSDGHPDPVPIPAGFPIALERAVILAGKDDVVVDIHIEGGEMRVSGTYRYGDLYDRASLKGSHPDARGSFSAKLVTRGLKTSRTMSLNSRALLLRSRDDDLYAVAPRYVPGVEHVE